MSRVVIIGPPGAGKTEFAEKLGNFLGIKKVNHLDHYFWKPGWVRTTGEERHSIILKLIEEDKWIIEGNFLDTIDDQFSRADIVVWLNLSAFICLYRVVSRYFSYMRNERPEIADGCRDKITPRFLFSIFLYKIVDTKILKKKLLEKKSLPLVVLNTPGQVAAYLNAVETRRSLL
jgi:adenylate kinase family enzyme